MTNSITQFSKEQAAAIVAPIDTDACVTAPPGAGKTQTAAGRVAYLLKKGGLSPRNILCVTYTDSAADNLKQRIAALVREKCGGDILGLVELQVGTFHGIALDFLRRFIPRFSQHRVLPEAQRRLLVRSSYAKIGIGRVERREGRGKRATTRFLTDDPNDIRLFLDACDMVRGECLSLARLPVGLRDAYQGYLNLLVELRRFDFAQILTETRAALTDSETPECLTFQRYISQTVRQILCDEYQDVSPLLVRTLDRLHTLGARLWVVGDVRQSILGFSGGDPRSLSDFTRRFAGARSFALTQNFRSSPQILDAATMLLPDMGIGSLAADESKMQAMSHHVSERGDLAALVLSTVEAQDTWGAHRIQMMHGTLFVGRQGAAPRPLGWSDMAVLVRRRETGHRVATCLRAAGVPVYVHGAEHLLESDEADAVASLFEYLAERTNRENVCTTFRRAELGITDEKVDMGLLHLDGVRATAEADPHTPVCLIRTLYDALGKMGFEERRIPRFKKGKESDRRELVMHNVSRIARAVQDYQAVNYLLAPTSRKFVEFAIWLRQQAPLDYSESGGGGTGDVIGLAPDAVHILTLHRSKAKEYPLVWIPDVSDGEIPIATWTEKSRVWNILPRSEITAPSRFDGTPEEEERLCFVGITRAMRFLFLTAPDILQKGNKNLPPSHILREFQRNPLFVVDPHDAPPTALEPKLPPHHGNGSERDGVRDAVITQTPSELSTFFSCPYQWRLRVGFAFPPPAVESLGHPDSIHAAIREYHERELRGELPKAGSVSEDELNALAEELTARHHHAPFATPQLLPHLRAAAVRKVKAYLKNHWARVAESGERVDAVEQLVGTVIGGVNFVGRYDMSVFDAEGQPDLFDTKMSVAASRRDPELLVCRIYGLGYEALRGTMPARVGHRVVGASQKHDRSIEMDEVIAEDTRLRITDAARAIILNVLPARPAEGDRTCRQCDPAALCFRGRGLHSGKAVSARSEE